MDLKYFSKKNKPDFNFISPKIRRYITTQNTLHVQYYSLRDCMVYNLLQGQQINIRVSTHLSVSLSKVHSTVV